MSCLSTPETRVMGLVLQEKIAELWEQVAPLQYIAATMTLNQEDDQLPSSSLVRSLWTAYQALSIPSLSISTLLTTLTACTPEVLIYDGTWSYTQSPAVRY